MADPVQSLVKHIYWERILPILPNEVGHGRHDDVEITEGFLMHRSLTLDISSSQGLEAVIQNSLEAIEAILGKRQIIIQLEEGEIQSVLVLLRLLSDNMEYVWEGVEAKRTRHSQSDGAGAGAVVGFSTFRPCFHSVSPPGLPSQLAFRLLELCTRIKFDTNSLHFLGNMSQQLYGSDESLDPSNILFSRLQFLRQRNCSEVAVKTDSAIDYILRFLSASNPPEFTKYLRHFVLRPFLEGHVNIEQGALHFLDFFGCFYLNIRSVAQYLEMVRNMANSMKKTIYHCLLLYYSSRSLMFWMMSRPREYIQVFRIIRRYTKPNNSNSNNTSYGITNFGNNNNNHDPRGDGDTSGIEESVFTNNDNSSSTSSNISLLTDDEVARPILQLSSALFEETYSTFHVSSLLTSITTYGAGNSNINTGGGNIIIGGGGINLTIGASSNNGGTVSRELMTSQSASPSMSVFSTNHPGSNSTNSNFSDSEDQRQNLDKWSSDPRPLQPEVPHMPNVLELYTTPDGSEFLIHTSILRFLMTLSMFDPDLFTELNSTSFRNIPDVKDNGSNYARTDNEEKDKPLGGGIKHFTHGLKKLNVLPSSKKKSVKLISIMIKNITGSPFISDHVVMDTIRSLTILFAMVSSISPIDPKMPSVQFCKRLLPIISCNLDLGKGWEKETKLNPYLQKCLIRHPTAYGRLQIKFFAAATQLEKNTFLSHLQLNEIGVGCNLKKLAVYTEGFRVFFHLPTTRDLREGTALRTAEFLKTLFYWVPDVLVTSLPCFECKITNLISSILDGSILADATNCRFFKIASNSSSSSIASVPNSQHALGCSPTANSTVDIYNNQSIMRTNSNTSSSSETSSIATPINQTLDVHSGHLIAPKARRVSGNSSTTKRNSILISPEVLEADRATHNGIRLQGGMVGIASSTQFTGDVSKVSTNTSPGIRRSPLRQAKQRNGSDDMGVRPFRVNVVSTTTNIVTTPTGYPLSSPPNVSNTESLANCEPDARRIMINVFSVFKRITDYIVVPHLENVDPEWPEKDFKSIVKSIFCAIIDADAILQVTAQSFMDILINCMSEFTDKVPLRTSYGYYKLYSYTITLFSCALFDLKLGNRKREILLDIILKSLKVRSRLAENIEIAGVNLDEFIEIERLTLPLILRTLGRGLFVSLYCNRNNVQKLIKAAYKEYCMMIKFHENILPHSDLSWTGNLGFAKAMAEDNYVASGSVAFQRRLRHNILKFIKYPNSILFDAMNFIYKRWITLAGMKNMKPEENSDFRSYGGMIAALSGVLLTVDTERYPSFSEVRIDLGHRINYFIAKQSQWLNNHDLLTRENARDILSTELHPLSFKLLFSNLKSKLDDLKEEDLTGPGKDLSFILLEQIIIILRTILKREDDEQIMILFSVDVINFIDYIVEILEKIPDDPIKFFKAVIHMSKTFRAMETAEGNLGIVSHYGLKNKWLKLVTVWFKLTMDRDYDIENISRPHREMDLKKRDLDVLVIDTAIESSKALAFLTKGVPLEVPPSVSEEELKRSKFVVFGNYFNILLKGLEKSTDLDRYPPSLKHKISVLNENVIISLTNLSNANVDAGLQYSIPLAYSKDKNIKIAFLKVFLNIVSNYSSSEEKKKDLKLRAQNDILLYGLKNPSSIINFTKVCPANEIDSLAAGLVNAFDSRNGSIILVAELVKYEIRTALRPMDILRRNSCATRALSLFARNKGNEYLVRVLRPILGELINTGDYFEIEKLDPGNPSADTQVGLFAKYMTLLVNAITSSVDIFPTEMVIICQTIFSAVVEKFPPYVYVAVGSFVFLRFLCPALVSPESEDIIRISETSFKRPIITLAKAIQSLANGSDNVAKWPALESQGEFLEDCRDRIFVFLKKVCQSHRIMNISINLDPTPVPFDFTYIHRYIYLYELDMRKANLNSIQSFNEFPRVKQSALMIDENLAVLGQPREELRNEIPQCVIDNKEENPQLYEFMSRHAFRSIEIFKLTNTFVHESMSPDGLPTLTITVNCFASKNIEPETIIYRTFQIYARIWSVKHYMVMDCTKFDEKEVDAVKLTLLFDNLLPTAALENCCGYYYFNITESFVNQWNKLFTKANPYVAYKVPHYFFNSYSQPNFVKALGLSKESTELATDVRVSIHDIVMYDEKKRRFVPVSLKVGNKHFQVLQETSKQYKIQGWANLVEMKFNNVFRIDNVCSVNISSYTGVTSEFTINLEDGKTLVFSSPKYLEIVKMFYYSLAKISDEYGLVNVSPDLEKNNNAPKNKRKQESKTLCHLLSIIMVGFYTDNDTVKNISYNLLVATHSAFKLDFGSSFLTSPEVHVPGNFANFLHLISKSISKSSPYLTRYKLESFIHAMSNQLIPYDNAPETIFSISYWIPNLYKYVYLYDEEEGPEVTAQIIRGLIRLTVAEPSFTAVYLQKIWLYLVIEGDLTFLIVEEVLNHALDRDSENRDWRKLLPLLNALPTMEVASHIINRLMGMIKSFLPSLKMETFTQSWSELTILVQTMIPLFFEAPLMSQMFLPEALFIASLLVDVGPNEIRSSIYDLLMTVCHSLTVNSALPPRDKQELEEVCNIFSRQRFRFMFGFSQYKGRILQSFSASSFACKFAALEQFTVNILRLMEYSGRLEATQWKTRYKKYLVDTVFNSDSFLSARAMMILGIIGKNGTSEILCKNLLDETLKVCAEPHVTDEQMFLLIAHVFTYSKVVEGLDPSLELMKQLFWFSSVIVESPNPVIFEGGLLFMANCINRLYENHFKDNRKESLISSLMKSRFFMETYLEELESYSDDGWNEVDFCHRILLIICRGCSVPSVRGAALEFLHNQFRNSYHEYELYSGCTHHLCYLLFLYLLLPPEQFRSICDENIPMEDSVMLGNNNWLPACLVNWIASNEEYANITLYQGAVLFNSTVSDEPCKIRFALIMRFLSKANPPCVFNFYVATRQELRRISALERGSECLPVSFDILRMMVKHQEVSQLDQYNQRSLAHIRERGLGSITKINIFDQGTPNIIFLLESHADLMYHRKRTITLMLSRICCYEETA